MNWKKYKISDIADVYDGPHATPKEAQSGPVYLGIKNLLPQGGIDLNEIRYISENEFPKWTKRVTPKENDIVFSYEATLHRYAIIPKGFVGCLGRRLALVRIKNGSIDHQFLYYYFINEEWKDFINNNKLTGSTVDRIPIAEFPNYFVHIPSLSVQKRIAAILAVYDNLIANNLKRIQLLEESAQLLYKQLIQEIKKSSLKKEEYIKDCVEFYIGGGWGQEEYRESYSEPAFVIRGTDIPNIKKGNIEKVPFRFHKASNQKSRNLLVGDIIFEVSGGSKDQPVGRSFMLTGKLLQQFGKPVMCASFCKLLRVNKKISPEFFFAYLTESYTNGIIKQYEKHSASNIVNYAFEEFINEQKILIPSETDLKEFTDKTRNIYQLISTLGFQNAKLREARDILLPKLMNGEIEV